MKTKQKSQSVSVMSDSLNRGCNENLKKFNLFCLKSHSSQPLNFDICQLNDCSFSRRDIFDFLFGNFLPSIIGFFPPQSLPLVSIDRAFFSPFNMYLNFKRYGFRLGYLKILYPFLADKILVSRVQFKDDYYTFDYILFAKEVTHE